MGANKAKRSFNDNDDYDGSDVDDGGHRRD